MSAEHVGRWPANVILDDEAAAMLDEQSGTTKSGKMKAGIQRANRAGWAGPMPSVTGTETIGDSGGASRFFYVAKASRGERDAGLVGPEHTGGELTNRKEGSAGLANPRAGAGCTSGGKNTHPTVKPITLMRYLVRLVTPTGGTVLDPFMGSGTTGIAAQAESFSFVGVELSAEYVETARQRIEHWREAA